MGIAPMFNHSYVDGYLNCFQFMAIMKKAAMNICAQVFVWEKVLISFG